MAKFSLVPQESKFYDLFTKSAHNVVDIAVALKDLLYNWENVPKRWRPSPSSSTRATPTPIR